MVLVKDMPPRPGLEREIVVYISTAPLAPRIYEGGGPKGRGEKKELPQSKIGSEEPIFASPLLKSGGRGGFAAG